MMLFSNCLPSMVWRVGVMLGYWPRPKVGCGWPVGLKVTELNSTSRLTWQDFGSMSARNSGNVGNSVAVVGKGFAGATEVPAATLMVIRTPSWLVNLRVGSVCEVGVRVEGPGNGWWKTFTSYVPGVVGACTSR